jgi:hypothetical protein
MSQTDIEIGRWKKEGGQIWKRWRISITLSMGTLFVPAYLGLGKTLNESYSDKSIKIWKTPLETCLH